VTLADLLGSGGLLEERLPDFRARPGQLQMAEAIERSIASAGRLLVEAGTGTGKTFAYLLPALLSGKRVIVSTGTRTLQDQLYRRDIPALAAAIGRPLRVALLKGRANYLCRHRLTLAQGAPELPGIARARSLARVLAWAAMTTNGDIGELAEVAENDGVWPNVTSTRENCLGQACAEYASCHVASARRAALAADLVIVNHHLLLADMTLREEGFGELLPGVDAVILDEAHQLPDTAAQFFGLSIGSRSILALCRDAEAELRRTGLADAPARAELRALEGRVADLAKAVSGFGERIEYEALSESARAALGELDLALAPIAERFGDERLEAPALRHCGARARELRERLAALEAQGPESGLRWIGVGATGFSLEFSPFEVAERLGAHFDARPCAWICTSATLAVGEDFSHFSTRIGLPEAPTLLIESPFDYERNARIYLPAGLPEPAQAGYTAAVLAAALPVIAAAGGRSFVLFTSHRALGEGARWFRSQLGAEHAFTLLVQGEAPRALLLERFRELENAVLLGTGSFWEGVDVKGPALSVVVIDKLPFASPEDPLLKARLAGIEREGRNPFSSYQLPQAVLALKQGVGRLIRSPEDTGVVVLPDPRLRSKGYGRAFLRSLPPMTVTSEAREVVEFLRRELGPPARSRVPQA
jgi:ATP-dependent DNA helicase DinG